MRIKHYPGKAVMHDPAWLEMDIPTTARGKQYEANWEDAQKTLSTNSSASNTWDKYSQKSMDGTVSSRLGQYQTMLDEIKKDAEDQYAVPVRTGKDSMRLKYHSDKCLGRINSKSKKDFEEEIARYFLPSQKEKTLKLDEQAAKAPKPKPRKKLMTTFQNREKFKVVIDDLQKHIKKSVRFDEADTEIGDPKLDAEEYDKDDENQSVHEERISTWVQDQNKYIVDNEADESETTGTLKRTDSGYYGHSEKPRQRLPPRHIYPSSSSSSSSSEQCIYAKSSSSSSSAIDRDEDVYSLYKDGSSPKRKAAPQPRPRERTKNASPNAQRVPSDSADFLIPRPKLIVPVHTYAVRKRRTGNILSECYDSETNSTTDPGPKRSNKGSYSLFPPV